MRKFKNYIIFYTCLIILLIATNVCANWEHLDGLRLAATSSSLDWMDQYSDQTYNSGICIDPPERGNRIDVNSLKLSTKKNVVGEWVDAGVQAQSGKSLEVNVIQVSRNTQLDPDKYLVLYRIDPRLPKTGQTFIIKFDKNLKAFISLFHEFGGGKFIRYQKENISKFGGSDPKANNYFINVINEYERFFTGNDAKILVKAGDVIDIALISAKDFFNNLQGHSGAKSKFTEELLPLDGGTDSNGFLMPYGIYTSSGQRELHLNIDNAIIYYSPNAGKDFINSGGYSKIDISKELVGIKSSDNKESLVECGPFGLFNSTCIAKLGRGMRINLDNDTIKAIDETFVKDTTKKGSILSGTAEGFYHIEVENDSKLNFFTPLPLDSVIKYKKINKVYSNNILQNYCSSPFLFVTKCLDDKDINIGKRLVGRYFMYITIGKNNKTSNRYDNDIEYIISDKPPGSSDKGVVLPEGGVSMDASKTGKLWFRLTKNIDEAEFDLKYKVYKGSSGFSKFLFKEIFQPISDNIQKLSELFYSSLVKNPALKKVVDTLATLYISLYALYFLIGATQITAYDLVIRVFKIAIIVILFSENSWSFFNEHLFLMFTDGTMYLVNTVLGTTSSVNNPFGFLDPIFEKYVDKHTWAIIGIELLQVHNGIFLLAIITIISVVLFFRTFLEIFIGILMSMVSIAVMICLAPIFITFILFERTKSIFEKWLFTLLNYTIYPLFIIIFLLIIDQLIDFSLESALPRVCWGKLFDIVISIDLGAIGIPTQFKFKLPFLPSIFFFMPETKDTNIFNAMSSGFASLASGTFLFYSFSLMSYNLLGYTQKIIKYLAK